MRKINPGIAIKLIFKLSEKHKIRMLEFNIGNYPGHKMSKVKPAASKSASKRET
jgi:hypothetical protein